MALYTVTLFKQYDFQPGEKITLTSGPRKGDWLVKEQTAGKVTLKCPISGREFTWNRFCYMVEKLENEEWPHKD